MVDSIGRSRCGVGAVEWVLALASEILVRRKQLFFRHSERGCSRVFVKEGGGCSVRGVRLVKPNVEKEGLCCLRRARTIRGWIARQHVSTSARQHVSTAARQHQQQVG